MNVICSKSGHSVDCIRCPHSHAHKSLHENQGNCRSWEVCLTDDMKKTSKVRCIEVTVAKNKIEGTVK